MKKLFFLSVIFLTATASFFLSCNENKGGSGKPYTLKMRMKKGDKFGQDMEVKMNMTMNLAGKEMGMDMGLTALLHLK